MNKQQINTREHPLTIRVSFSTLDSLKREAKNKGETVSSRVNDILLQHSIRG